MIKCDNCGAKISLETLRCPECKAINQIAKEHYEELAAYDNKYKRALAGVRTQAREYRGFNWRLVALGFLVLTTAFVIVFMHSPVDVYTDLFVMNTKTEQQIKEQMMDYVRDCEFEKQHRLGWAYRSYLPYNDSYDTLYFSVDHFDNFVRISSRMPSLVNEGDDSAYRTKYEAECKMAATEAEAFKTIYNQMKDKDLSEFQEQGIHDMLQRLNVMLKYYWKLSDEEISEFWKADVPTKRYMLLQKADGE